MPLIMTLAAFTTLAGPLLLIRWDKGRHLLKGQVHLIVTAVAVIALLPQLKWTNHIWISLLGGMLLAVLCAWTSRRLKEDWGHVAVVSGLLLHTLFDGAAFFSFSEPDFSWLWVTLLLVDRLVLSALAWSLMKPLYGKIAGMATVLSMVAVQFGGYFLFPFITFGSPQTSSFLNGILAGALFTHACFDGYKFFVKHQNRAIRE